MNCYQKNIIMTPIERLKMNVEHDCELQKVSTVEVVDYEQKQDLINNDQFVINKKQETINIQQIKFRNTQEKLNRVISNLHIKGTEFNPMQSTRLHDIEKVLAKCEQKLETKEEEIRHLVLINEKSTASMARIQTECTEIRHTLQFKKRESELASVAEEKLVLEMTNLRRKHTESELTRDLYKTTIENLKNDIEECKKEVNKVNTDHTIAKQKQEFDMQTIQTLENEIENVTTQFDHYVDPSMRTLKNKNKSIAIGQIFEQVAARCVRDVLPSAEVRNVSQSNYSGDYHIGLPFLKSKVLMEVKGSGEDSLLKSDNPLQSGINKFRKNALVDCGNTVASGLLLYKRSSAVDRIPVIPGTRIRCDITKNPTLFYLKTSDADQLYTALMYCFCECMRSDERLNKSNATDEFRGVYNQQIDHTVEAYDKIKCVLDDLWNKTEHGIIIVKTLGFPVENMITRSKTAKKVQSEIKKSNKRKESEPEATKVTTNYQKYRKFISRKNVSATQQITGMVWAKNRDLINKAVKEGDINAIHSLFLDKTSVKSEKCANIKQ
jgi:hypothetical protein